MRFLPPLLLLLVACPPEPEPDADKQETGQVAYDDRDGDGVVDDADCAPDDATTHVGADELCDGVDNDCDGELDEDAVDEPAWYADGDGDGYGDAATTRSACTQPDGYVENDSDCNDALASIFPGNPELCDGLDNDCNDIVDDDGVPAPWYADADGDGYGDDSTEEITCDPAEGWVTTAGDCDDADGGRSPGKTEVCDALATDEDCDGLADDADPSTDSATMPAWSADADGDGYGDPFAVVAACEMPAGYTDDVRDCDDTRADISPAGQEVCDAADADEDCDGLLDDGDPSVSAASYSDFFEDADLDGYGSDTVVRACDLRSGISANDTDCNDGNAAISPGATEACDSFDLDEDCDGLSDNNDPSATGTSTFYADVDNDAYGNAASPLAACDEAGGVVANSTDCDDGDPGTHPGAAERCDSAGKDNDCDGVSDDDDPSTEASSKSSWYSDADADGYGAGAATLACVAPAGTVSNSSDCSDSSALIAPGAAERDSTTACMADLDDDGYGDDAPAAGVTAGADCDDALSTVSPLATETCSTTYDDDCDASSNDPGATGCSTFYADADADGYGSGTSQCACVASGTYTATNADDCDDTRATVSPVATETCSTSYDDDCDGGSNDVGATGCTAYYYDADGDRYGITTSQCTCSGTGSYTATVSTDCDDADAAVSPGATEVCVDGVDDDCDGVADDGCPTYDWTGDFEAELSYSRKIYGEDSSDSFGYAVSAAGDHDADGYDDIVVGAYKEDTGGTDAGAVYVYEGPYSYSAAEASRYDYAKIYNTDTGYTFGEQVYWVPDYDGDGNDELFVRRDSETVVTSDAMPYWEGALSTGAQLYTTYDAGSATGSAAASAGDFNSRAGNEDWIVGDPQGSSTKGTATVYVGSAAYLIATGETSADYAGTSVAGGGDMDGDGYDEVIIGAWGYDDGTASASGAAYIVTGGTSGSLGLASADNKLRGTNTNDYFGFRVLTDDVDLDGYADAIVSAYGDDTGGLTAGAIHIFTDPLTDSRPRDATVSIYGNAVGDSLGAFMMSLGDTNADGELDLLAGAANSDLGATNGGAAFLQYGPFAATIDLATDYDGVIYGTDSSGGCGRSGDFGDVDGDGLMDMVFGCAGGGSGSIAGYGVVYVFPGA